MVRFGFMVGWRWFDGFDKVKSFVFCVLSNRLDVLIILSGCRKDSATPEEIEYFDCQQEMSEELYTRHQVVERIICELPAQSHHPDPVSEYTSALHRLREGITQNVLRHVTRLKHTLFSSVPLCTSICALFLCSGSARVPCRTLHICSHCMYRKL